MLAQLCSFDCSEAAQMLTVSMRCRGSGSGSVTSTTGTPRYGVELYLEQGALLEGADDAAAAGHHAERHHVHPAAVARFRTATAP